MNSPRSAENGSRAARDEVWLLGQPPLHQYLAFVKDVVIGGEEMPVGPLVAEWNRASEHYQQLEESESGIADQARISDLDPALAPLAAEVTENVHYRETFDSLPTTIVMVELDTLIVYQKSVTWTFVESLSAELGPSPDPEKLFRFCLPTCPREAAVSVRREGSRRYVFRSESMDIRYHRSRLFRAEQIRDHAAFGPVLGVVGVVVGFGSNFLNVIRSGDRMILHNGYHRACALRSLGITRAPAIVQTVNTSDELQLTAKSVVTQDPDFYFRSARPPLLKDFFDPKIRRVLPTPPITKVIEVSYEVRDYTVTEEL